MMDKLRRIIREEVRTITEAITSAKSALSEWDNTNAASYAAAITERVGPPHYIVPEGTAKWINVGNVDAVVVQDESVQHNFPKEHRDYVYSTMKIEVPPEFYTPLASVTGSIILDGLKNDVTTRCGSLTANAVTLGFVQDVVEGRTEPTKEEYARRITNNIAPDWYQDPLNEI